MAVAEVYLTGMYENMVTSKPHVGHVNIEPTDPTLSDDVDDVILYGGGDILLDEGAFRVALPEGREFTAKAIIHGNPRRELDPVVFTLLQTEATEVIEDDGEGGQITFYEKDITDFYPLP